MTKRRAPQICEMLLADGVPLEQVLRLLDRWGGLPLSIPRAAAADHPIASAAGAAAMESLCRHFPGERLVMPLGRAVRRELLRREVVALIESGLNRAQIARQLGLHLRQVQRLGNSAPHIDIPSAADRTASKPSPQLDMAALWSP